ncbi:sialidase family protein [Ghiorsea bivora]|uniref:sialidase family protein n=1 Tax=Ghiorsea bivora TaxID=1485545 RepID=UPI00056EDFFF|nr:sialidase family protein [Ghiorsea bivora]
MAKYVFVTFWLVAAFGAWQHVQAQKPWSSIAWSPIFKDTSSTPLYREQLIPNAGQGSTHSVSTAVLPSGDLVAFWFGGSREGAKDVRIFQSFFKQTQQVWTTPTAILDVPTLAASVGRYIGKLGNPLVFIDQHQRMWLYVVSVSYGGWAGSSLNVMFSDDLGKHWNTPKKLITSPFINVSTLVRNTMYAMQDGSMLLPVYHEFAAQLPELLRVSPQGEVMEKVRMYGNGGGIQPSLVQGKNRQVYAFMRAGSHTQDWKVIRLKSKNEGKTWSDFTLTDLPNPNSAQIVEKVDGNLWIWVGNHNPKHRQDLTLAVSHDLEKPWQVVYQFEQGKNHQAFSYPAIVQGKDGVWNLLYTANRKNIKHVQFNRAWLNQVMQQMDVQQVGVQ